MVVLVKRMDDIVLLAHVLCVMHVSSEEGGVSHERRGECYDCIRKCERMINKTLKHIS